MKDYDIIHALSQKVVDTIYDEWHHEGHIEVEHSDDFWFTLDGRLYCAKIFDVDCERHVTKSDFDSHSGYHNR